MKHLVVFIDDAADIFWKRLEDRDDPPPIFSFVSEVREYAVSIVAATQFPELLGTSIFNNSFSTIALRMPSEVSRRKIAECM